MLKIAVTSRDHIQGSIDAPVLLVEYGDYECPHCGHALPHREAGATPFREPHRICVSKLSLKEAHPHAEPAAELAEFAGDHDRFWEMHDALFENQESLSAELFVSLANELGLSSDDWLGAMESGMYRRRVVEDFAGGVRSGVNGTPTFFISGRRHDGPFEFDDLVAAVTSQLNASSGPS